MDRLPPEALEAGAALQWPIDKMPFVGSVLLIFLFLHLIPRTAIFGAVLLTGYLGGSRRESRARIKPAIHAYSISCLYFYFNLAWSLSKRFQT